MDRAEVRPPAVAYLVLAGLLPVSFFLRPAPAAGVRLVIEGGDGIRTIWDVSEQLAHELHKLLQRRPVRIVSVATYTTTPATP